MTLVADEGGHAWVDNFRLDSILPYPSTSSRSNIGYHIFARTFLYIETRLKMGLGLEIPAPRTQIRSRFLYKGTESNEQNVNWFTGERTRFYWLSSIFIHIFCRFPRSQGVMVSTHYIVFFCLRITFAFTNKCLRGYCRRPCSALKTLFEFGLTT